MPRKILYIDDDEGLRRLVALGLSRTGTAVLEAKDGDAGLRLLAEHDDVDAVAVDIYMPGLDGIAITERINALPNHPPVIVVTGAQDSRMAVSALKAGAFDYVVKDVQGEFIFLLRAALQSAVDAMRMRRAKEAAEAEVRAARDRFEALAAERAMLLQEVNHRVGNSLQMIASLLFLQSRSAGAGDVSDALEDAIGRVMAVAQVHRRLYTSSDVQSVAVDQYLAAMIEDLRRSGHSAVLTQVTLQADPVQLPPDQAVAIGVIVNELITNAVKYAYPDGKGPIRVMLKHVGDDATALIVEDDGVGSKARPDPHSTGLGRRIVTAMGEKLNARIEDDMNHRGTRTVVSFPRRKEQSSEPAALSMMRSG
jgi:two-component sensor histidine kinase